MPNNILCKNAADTATDQIYKKYEKVTKDTDRAYKAVIKEMLKEWQAEKAKKAATENAANQELQ